MPFDVSYDYAEEGITVPYPSERDDIRNNRGFVDLRGNPTAAATIAEASDSAALRSVLTRLAQPGCLIASLGCDLGSHEEPNLPMEGRHVAGGYVQVASLGVTSGVTPQMCERYAQTVARRLSRKAQSRWWRLSPTFGWVHSYLNGHLAKIPSVWFWFWCLARSPDAAIDSRECLLAAFNDALLSKNALAKLNLRT